MTDDTRHYIFNLETTKIELHFQKSDYAALTDEQKGEIKSAFLWSGSGKCWVSRAKEPNLWRAKQVASKLGFTEEKREGERLTYGEQLEQRAERAEARADRYDGYAHNATNRAEQLQKPINDRHGDISFFTQPNINSSAGRAFSNYRDKLFARYERGFEEYRKSDYFKDRAQTARETASNAQLENPGYLDRRIKECKTRIREIKKSVIQVEGILSKLEHGEQPKHYGGILYDKERCEKRIEYLLEQAEVTMDKQAYLENCLEEAGGNQFNKGNIKPGYIVDLQRWGSVEIIGTGPLNVTYKILDGGAKGFGGKAAYAEIKDIIKAEEKKTEVISHPFQVGEKFTVVNREYPDGVWKPVETKIDYEIVRASVTTISLKPVGSDEKAIIRKPYKTYSGDWCFSVNDTLGNTFRKSEPPPEQRKEGQQQERPSTLDKLADAKKQVDKVLPNVNAVSKAQDKNTEL